LDLEMKRILFGMTASPINRSAARLAGELARSLDLEVEEFVRGLGFNFEPSVTSVYRELIALEQRWAPVDPVRMRNEQAVAVRCAHRQLEQELNAELEKPQRSTQVKLADSPIDTPHAGDMLILGESLHCGTLALQPFSGMAREALDARAFLILVTHNAVRRNGRVLAIAKEHDERVVGTATIIAAAFGSQLGSADPDLPKTRGISGCIPATTVQTAVTTVVPALNAAARLIVVGTRDFTYASASSLALTQRAPVLIVPG
jgi:hypothetical protein